MSEWIYAKMPKVEIPEGCEDMAGLMFGAPSMSEEAQLEQLLGGIKCRHNWELVRTWSTDPMWPEKHEQFKCANCFSQKRLTWGIGMLYPAVGVMRGGKHA